MKFIARPTKAKTWWLERLPKEKDFALQESILDAMQKRVRGDWTDKLIDGITRAGQIGDGLEQKEPDAGLRDVMRRQPERDLSKTQKAQ